MALQLWMGNAGSGKSHKLYQHIIKESNKHKELTYLIVVPEQFTLQTQHDLVMLHPDHGIMNIDILSFARLAYRVFEEVGFANASGILIDDMGKSLILRRLAGTYQEQLPLLGGNLKKLGYISEIKSVISEFMQYGVGSAEIVQLQEWAEASGKKMLQEKLKDISLLYHAFRDYIDEKYTTSEELLERVSSILPSSAKLKKSVVVFDGFTGFTPVQYRLLEALMQNCVDVYVTVLIDTLDAADEKLYEMTGEQELFYLSRKTIRELTKRAKTCQIEKRPDYLIQDDIPIRFRKEISAQENEDSMTESDAPGMLAHMEKNLFRQRVNTYAGKPTEAVRIFCASTPKAELRQAAIEIQNLIREKHYRYKEIAVVTGDIDTYMHCAESVFQQFEIPYFVDKTQPVLLNPFIEYLRAAVSVLSEQYSYEGIFRYLKSSLTDFTMEETDRLENYVLACGIKGKKQWTQRFVRKASNMETEELLELDALREKIAVRFSVFDDIYGKDAAVHVQAEVFYKFLVNENIQEKLAAYENRFMTAHDAVRAKEYAQIYKQVMDLLDKLVELLGDEVMSVREFGELLDAGFAEIRIGVIPAGQDYVQFGDLTRTRLRDIKALYFVGVNDGIIPMNSGGGGIISDMDREFLMESGTQIELAPSARMQAYTQRLYLYMVMTKPERRLCLSYAKISEEGKSIRPSYLIQTVCELFPDLAIEQTEESLLRRIGNEKAGFVELTEGLQPFLTAKGADTDYLELFSWYAGNPSYQKKTEELLKAAFSMDVTQRNDQISRAVAATLYGKTLVSSVTRLESYARCAYQHFLSYGIGLREREIFSFEAKDMGVVFHDALQIYAQLLEKSTYTWFDIPKEKSLELINTAVEQCIAAGDYAAIYSSFRTTYMVQRMKRITARTVSVLASQIKKGSFQPKSFELAFSAENDYQSLNIKLTDEEYVRLRGRIDRMDVYEDAGHVYVKIIDYKSGNQSFDLAAVYQGTQLQLVVYLNAAMEMQERDNRNKNKEVVPAGILYYHIDDPIVDASRQDTPEDINQRIVSQLVMKGIVNSEDSVIRLMDNEFEKNSDVIPVARLKTGELSAKSSVASTEDFHVISDYVNWKIGEMGSEILAGNVKAQPQDCTYCKYKTICHMHGEPEAMQNTTEQELSDKDAVIARMKETMKQGGGK